MLSRGDLSVIIEGIENKSKLLEKVQGQRNSVESDIIQWQKRKTAIKTNNLVSELENVLENMEMVIKEFLEDEQKLKMYMEKLYGTQTGVRA
ncbi:hypothetical protein QA601_07010 [Chitinispirillales bacterium ANBcel5]|uniref:hypothetical protein n=1 Tax=Cellulosispirillum alkaliphilum TaxID=3039283 RepID=UPI002A56DE00|nr:hypothetical protein [Chitinispirillales bacterium ANBcel5]